MPSIRRNEATPQDPAFAWARYPFPRDDGARIHRIGDAVVCVALENAGQGEFLAAVPLHGTAKPRRGKSAGAVELPPPDDPAWRRMLVKGADDYELAPAYPKPPVCVRLKESFLLPPGADLEGWIFSRVEAQVLVSGALLASLPLRKAHKTLYGQPDSGVVCRYDEAEFLQAGEPLFASMESDPGLVAHPVRLRNASQEALLVSELCIYGEQLSIFGKERRMMSERLSFAFSSSGVRMSLDGPASASEGWSVLAKPRVSGEERFIVRSFELFRAITRLS